MKKITKLFGCLAIALGFVSCNQNGLSQEQLIQLILLSPDKKIDRNQIVQNIEEINLDVDTEYDFSSKQGKKAFLTVINKNSEMSTRLPVFNDNIDEIKPTAYSESQGISYLNVPFNPPKLNYPLQGTTPFNLSSNVLRTENQSTPSIGDKKDFYAATLKNKTNAEWAKDSVLKVIGQHCYVWYKAKEGISITDDQLQALADSFDTIYEKETYIFGKNTLETQPDNSIINITDENIKINIIVYDLFNDVEDTRSKQAGTFGYFWTLDFQKQDLETEDEIYYSNKCQCLHIDSFFLEAVPKAQQSTIAHEFQHLLHYVNKSLKYGPVLQGTKSSFRTSETWFNEMMSMVCEDIMQSQLNLEDKDSPKYRLKLFNQYYYYGFKNWYQSDDQYISYANAYAFGAFLLRNFGIDFIRKLATNNYINEQAITRALIDSNASLKSFNDVLDKYYNVVLNPKGDYYTLNKSVSKTYTDIAGNKTVEFKCDAINLFDYCTFEGNELNFLKVNDYYQASRLNDYYGPVILNKLVYKSLDSYGMYVSYLGDVGITFSTTFKISSDSVNTSGDITYKFVFTD